MKAQNNNNKSILKECFFFDMGNTIFDFHKSKYTDEELDKMGMDRAKQYLNGTFNATVSQNVFAQVILPWFDYIALERKQVYMEFPIIEELYLWFSKNQIRICQNKIHDFFKILYSGYAEHVFLNHGFVDLCEKLKRNNKKIVLVSNNAFPDFVYIDIFQKAKIKKYFDYFSFSFSNIFMKPHPSIFIKALMATNSFGSDCIMIGDNETADIHPAIALGMDTCLFDIKRSGAKTKAKYRVQNFMELHALL